METHVLRLYARGMDLGRIIITWTRNNDGSFGWDVAFTGEALTDEESEALLREVADRL